MLHSRVPSLVGLDLWEAINDEREGLRFKMNGNLSRGVDINRYSASFRDPQQNNINLLGSYPEVMLEDNQNKIRRNEYSKNMIHSDQKGKNMNTLNNNLIKEVLNPTEQIFHQCEQNWFDWNFPNRGLTREDSMKEKFKSFSEHDSRDTDAKNIRDTLMDFKTPLMDQNSQFRNMDPFWRGLSSTNQKIFKKDNCCRFCLKNGEVQVYYESHSLKDSAGNVVCPILSKYVCPCCGATGKKAHTVRHCPLNAQFAFMLGANYKVKRRNAAGRITSFRL